MSSSAKSLCPDASPTYMYDAVIASGSCFEYPISNPFTDASTLNNSPLWSPPYTDTRLTRVFILSSATAMFRPTPPSAYRTFAAFEV